MDYKTDKFSLTDTPLERQLRSSVADLRTALYEMRADVDRVLDRIDNGQRVSSSMHPGKAIDASRVNGYAAIVDALLLLPWGDDYGMGDPEIADEIVKHAGRLS